MTLPNTGFSTIAWLVIEPSKIDERFDRALSSLLENVHLNRQSSGALSVKGTVFIDLSVGSTLTLCIACLNPFMERWIANWQDLVNHPHFSIGRSLSRSLSKLLGLT